MIQFLLDLICNCKIRGDGKAKKLEEEESTADNLKTSSVTNLDKLSVHQPLHYNSTGNKKSITAILNQQLNSELIVKSSSGLDWNRASKSCSTSPSPNRNSIDNLATLRRKKRQSQVVPNSASLVFSNKSNDTNIYVNNQEFSGYGNKNEDNNSNNYDSNNNDDFDFEDVDSEDYSYVHQNNTSYQTNNSNSYINFEGTSTNQLLSSNSNTNSEDTASISSTTTSSQSSSMKLNVINEIVQTERNYVKSLTDIVECFKRPLEETRIVSKQELNLIFVNIEDLIAVNTEFFNKISRRVDDARSVDQNARIGDILVEYIPKMIIYSKYVSAKRSSEEKIMEKMKNSNEFNQIVNRAIEGETGDFLLKKLLLLPMQRLTQYSLLIDKLIKHSSDSDDDYMLLKKSSKLIVDLIRSINNEVGKRDDQERLAWLEDHVNVKGIGFKFRSQTNIMGARKLYYYGPLVKESSGKELYGFLFNDCFLIIEAYELLHNEIFRPSSSSRNSKFQQLQIYKHPIILDAISVVQAKQSPNSSDCTFQLVTDKEFSFRTTNPSLRNEWIKQLQKAIEMFKQKKRSSKLNSHQPIIQKNPIGRLLLLVMEAQDLVPDQHHERNSFCEALMGSQKFTTHTIETSNPKWNTSMQFQIYDLNKDLLTVGVYDRKVFSPNVFLGRIELKIMQIYREQMKENKENNPITRTFRMTSVPNGRIVLKMSISIYK